MKVLTGTVVSTKMAGTVVVEIVRHTPHPLYKKLIKKSKKIKADSKEIEVVVGQVVKIIETRPLSKGKNFRIFLENKKGVKVSV